MTFNKRALFTLLCLALSSDPASFAAKKKRKGADARALPEIGRLEGRLFESGTKIPLEGINVFVLPHALKAATDSKGAFRVEGLPPGPFQIVVNATGYERLELPDTMPTYYEVTGLGAPPTPMSAALLPSPSPTATPAPELEAPRLVVIERDLYLSRESYRFYETTVVGKEFKRDDTTRSVRAEEAIAIPGSFNDPVRAVQNLPGVNRPASVSAQIVIQGAGPNETAYTVDGHQVPLIFHFGGFSSVVFPQALDRVDLLTAGYGPEFGRANGGLVNLWTRAPRRDRVHGSAFLDTINAGALVEGPVGNDGALLLSGRFSYVSWILGSAFKDDGLNLTLAPTFSDTTLIAAKPLGDRADLKIVAVGSSDRLEFLLKEPLRQDPSLRGNFSQKTAFFRLIPQLTYRNGPTTTTHASIGAGKDFVKVQQGDNGLDLNVTALTVRAEVEHRVSSAWNVFVGLDNRHNSTKASFNLPTTFSEGGVSNPLSSGDVRHGAIQSGQDLLGLYLRNELRAEGSRWTFYPNLRFDSFFQTHEVLFQPRLAARCEISPFFALRQAVGMYYQPPDPQQLSAPFGNPALKSPRAYHANLGFDRDFREGSTQGWLLSSDVFYRGFDRQILQSAELELRDGALVNQNYSNNGLGYAYGIQNSVRYDAKPWSVSLVYTLSKSRRKKVGGTEYPFQYDQTHLIGLIGAYETGRWRFSSRLRYATGNPVTPILGSVYDSSSDSYIPIRGSLYSDRLKSFVQLDLRADYQWIFKKWILAAYLDIQNVTNAKNPEALLYSYDYSQQDALTGLPILPTIGLRAEF